MADIKKEYERWLANATIDADVAAELKTLDDTKIEDAFYRDLAFGTGGLRGVIGAGTNRMNIYTVAKASQGLADYLKKNFEMPSVAIGYDSRIKSDVFAKVAAGVFAANGVKVNIWPVLMPVPTVSFATRYLHTSAGVMVTASHNPSKYNGYKVYGADGCQITTEVAAEILAEIEKLDIFADVKTSDFEAGVANGSIQYIPDEVYTAFVEQVKSQSVLFGEEVNKNVAIVYSPLNGTGLKPVTRTLKEMGYTNITVVKEQEQPDGNFPTCPYPNPEIKEAMALGMEYAKKCNADLLLATDPDCDRVGIAVKNKAGEYELLTGNQTGMLLLDYICSQCVKHGKMPADPVMVKTIVTMDMGEQIATNYGLRTINVLTGFKFIGEQIGKLEKQGKADSYVFGFEESYGYLTGSYVRDKDGVDGAYMICEMFSYYATKSISLLDELDELYKTYGYCLNTLHSYEFDGSAGFAKMQSIMQAFRGDIEAFGGKKVVKLLDYAPGLDGLPKSDVLKFLLEDNCSIHPTNYGNLMMACAFIKYYADISQQKKSETPEFYLDVLDDEELNRVKASLPDGIKVYREDLYDRKRRGALGKLEKLVNIPREIAYNCKAYDMCVVLGGDCISQYYSTQVFVSDMVKFQQISKKQKMYLLGQTMGPFHGYAVGLVKRSLKNTMIYVRDHDCYHYLKETFDFPNLKEARDLAFLDIPYQDDQGKKKKLQSEFGLETDYITLVPSGARRQYTSDLENYLNEYIQIISYIVDTLNLDVLLLAHVIHVSDSNDKIIIDELMKRLDRRYRSRVHVVDHLIQPYEARILLGGGKATITGRMHAAVSSINMGTVPICLSYSVKFKGVIGDDFDLNDYIYQCRGDDIWASGNVHVEVIKRLNAVLENRESILNNIASKLEAVKKKSMLQIEELF